MRYRSVSGTLAAAAARSMMDRARRNRHDAEQASSDSVVAADFADITGWFVELFQLLTTTQR
jgi:hypothetical protein